MDAHIAVALLHRGVATAPSAAAQGDPFADVPLAAAAAAAAAAAGSCAAAPPSATGSASAVAATAGSEARQEAAALAAAAFAEVAAGTQYPDLEGLDAQRPELEMRNNAVGFASDAPLAVSAAAAVTAMAAAADAAAAAAADGQPAAMAPRWEGACSSPTALERRLLVADYAATAPPPPLAGLASPFDACWCTHLAHSLPHVQTRIRCINFCSSLQYPALAATVKCGTFLDLPRPHAHNTE